MNCMPMIRQKLESRAGVALDDAKYIRMPLTMPADLLAEAFRILNPSTDKDSKLISDRIDSALAAYAQRQAFDAASDSRRDQRSKLVKLAARVEQMRADLSALDEVCEGNIAVQLSLQEHRFGPRVDGLQFVQEFGLSSERLAVAIRQTIRDHFPGGRVARGPKPVPALCVLIGELSHIYEQFSENEVTHTTYKHSNEYAGEPCSHAGKFILMWVRYIDPTVAPTRVSTIMTALIHGEPTIRASRSQPLWHK